MQNTSPGKCREDGTVHEASLSVVGGCGAVAVICLVGSSTHAMEGSRTRWTAFPRTSQRAPAGGYEACFVAVGRTTGGVKGTSDDGGSDSAN